jgi:hypothetical protein
MEPRLKQVKILLVSYLGGTEEINGKLKLSSFLPEIWTRGIFQTKCESPCLGVELGVGE